MKTLTYLLRNAIVLLCLLISSGTFSQTVLGSYDFETATLEGWTSNGSDAYLYNHATRSYSGSYSLLVRNNGTGASFDSPLYSLNAYDKVDIKFFFFNLGMDTGEDFKIQYSSDGGVIWTTVGTFIAGSVAAKTADFQSGFPGLFYCKTVTILKTVHTFPVAPLGRFRIINNANSTGDYTILDLITVTGTTYATPTTGPGGVSSNLDLWLRADQLDGTTVGTDGANVTKWTDTGKGNHAETQVSGQEPVYRNNATNNINFNPVLEFENDHNTAASDMQYINTRDELMGTSGFNSNDMFLVVIADPTITTSMYPLDTFTSSDPLSFTYAEDVTGVGFGGYTQRLTGEYFTYCIGTSSGSGPYVGYGCGDLTGTNNYNQFNIINVRHNSTNSDMEMALNGNTVTTTVNDLPSYASVNDRKFWLGRSQYWNGSFDGRIAEVITYDSRKTDGTTERNRIESYLALKYGITLGTNGTSMDYVDSSGNVVWDINTGVPVEDVFNYNIAGIFRDDASDHSQKQSKTYNTTDDITIGLGDILATNSANSNTFGGDGRYLVWGNDNGTLAAQPAVIVDMSAGIAGLTTNVQFTSIGRTWKVVETGGDIGNTKVSIPEAMLSTTLTPPGSYLMFISDSPTFSPTSDYRVMSLNGTDLETYYDFDNTKFITFGYAPEVVVERSVYFDGTNDYLDIGDHKDLNTSFTVSAWIKRMNSSNDVSILSKRDAAFTTGYDFKLDGGARVEMIWNGGSDNIRSNVSIPNDIWHHIAVIYSGGTANLYIDGVLDQTETGLSNPTATSESFIIAAAGKTSTTDFFEGNIDEVRVWDVALSLDQLHYVMNQEIEENTNLADGIVLPTSITKNEINSINWSDLAGYYPMSIFTYTNTNDHSDNDNQGALRNLDTVDFQTAPLPYESDGSGSWDTNATWVNGSQQTIPGAASIVDSNITVDWNIVEVDHNITMSNATLPAVNNENRTVLGLIANSTKELTISADSGLTVTHYLELNGSIDLEGESQLIQTDNSVISVGANGDLERDQQGTADNYTYNYWSSPVGTVTTTSTNDTHASRFTIANVLSDGTTPASPAIINFITSGYDGTNTNPIGIADFWIWKFADQPDDDYSAWQHVRSTGNVLPGEGYTMKGPGTGSISTDQNYIFNGKPNNGDITLTISADNDYLVGNPYPSAIDALEFLGDNTDTSGTLYFWEHWGGGSHHLNNYQGGYALYNYAGGVGAPSYGTSDPDVNPGGTATKLPGQFIAVSQGFFVYSATGGTITFENDQRVFEKDDATGDDSIFVRNETSSEDQPFDYHEDGRMKFRIGFDSFNQLHRQLLLTVDQNATEGIDWGYEGKLNEEQIDDMYWIIEGGKYVIQGRNLVNEQSIAPLGIHVRDNGLNAITLDHLENVPDDVKIYVHDNVLNLYHDLRQNKYEVNLTSGTYLDRFSIVFTDPSSTILSLEDEQLNSLVNVFFENDSNNLIIQNPNLIDIKDIELFNLVGQGIFKTDEIESSVNSEINIPKISSGTYIINLSTTQGKISKKVLVK